ncbi:hypothetical protein [Lentzea aerocolonigenes]|uniref:hypothetical protein n=1 Tax=Lentzea aerocolonigenes TaxID=68170 RepID=UPI0004C36A49|nr:hypothetical protein [Lentzea aerocolonigenes]MCP2247684.1 hypothetical protein [Lentzea aerocolonigenes]
MPENSAPRRLDGLLRSIRGHIRTLGLPRPDRLVISTPSGSVHAEFTSGTAPDRLACLLVWAASLHGVELTWPLQAAGTLSVAATGRTASGITLGLVASASVLELGGKVKSGSGAVLAKAFRLSVCTPEQVTFDEVAQVVQAARVASAAAVVLEVAAA